MLNNSLDKLNFRTKVDTKLSKIATVGVNISGTYSKTERPKNNFIDFYRTPSLPVYHNAYSTDRPDILDLQEVAILTIL